ncbi:hypothetical protein J2X47_003699 [Sphingomonas sp. BE270]|jgi:hypothetical protein|uniref:DUF3768 domain-containing protein n=3 Tax=root TaxID=1 RepID=A0ABU4PH61_9SPHN|nr:MULTISPECIES: DUF3768 domain-containing protein [Sphingomonas]MDR7259495.1 hypothetical protein [Sphingomonas sp. BE270]MDX5983005.1 DUF3768 domain-containing protein [Sphingomonas echinoides]
MTDRMLRIAALNDRCRQGLDPTGRIVITAACLATLAEERGKVAQILAQADLMAAIRRYVFRPEESRERARGDLVVAGHAVRFTIDYYDLTLEWGSEDPADPLVTVRVMTIMLPSDD